MFRHISGHLQFHSWPLKRTDVEIYMFFLPQCANYDPEDDLK
jgi:hypothetical protein